MKQPVTPEPEQPPKRQPVPIEDEPVAVVTDVEKPKRVPPPLDEDGYRQCAREGCPERFKPMSLNPRNQEDVTEFYCSTACAEIEFRKAQGLAPRAATAESKRRSANGNSSEPERDAAKDAKYGPVRTIVSVISEKSGRIIVKLDTCGHQVSVKKGRKQTRCRKCKAPVQGAETAQPKRQPVPVERGPVTEVVKKFVEGGQRAQAAADAAVKAAAKPKAQAKKTAVKKPKRAPVKAAKRGARKKGKR